MLRCSDNSLYTGIAKDLQSRLDVHRKGQGSKYVKTRLPVQLEYTEEYASKSEALVREHEIKKLTKKQKETLAKTKLS